MEEKYMNQEEQKHIDEKFENLCKLFEEKINNLTNTLNKYITSSEKDIKEQQIQITRVHAIANDNEKKIIGIDGEIKKAEANSNTKITELEGRINTIEKVKEAEDKAEDRIEQIINKMKDRGIKIWQFVLGLSIPIIINAITFIIMLLLNKP